MRPASQEESMAHEWIKNEMDKVSQTVRRAERNFKISVGHRHQRWENLLNSINYHFQMFATRRTDLCILPRV